MSSAARMEKLAPDQEEPLRLLRRRREASKSCPDFRSPTSRRAGHTSAFDAAGPPLLQLHGNPLTHVAWHKVAPRLAERFHVVAADLRGYGYSSAPPEEPDSSNHSFRAMAQD
jgi:haloacetate dehalogenase